MKIILIQVEKTSEPYIEQGTSVYQNRLRNYITYDTVTINMPKQVRQKSFDEQKRAEAQEIIKQLEPSDFLVCLDEKGRHLSSVAFSEFISKRMVAGTKRLVFLIGGPFGIDQSVSDRAQMVLSLSDMTFSHQMIRLFFSEQLYRAFTIIRNEKYHHE